MDEMCGERSEYIHVKWRLRLAMQSEERWAVNGSSEAVYFCASKMPLLLTGISIDFHWVEGMDAW